MVSENMGMDIFVVLILSFLAFTYLYIIFLNRKAAKNGAPTDWPFVGMLPSVFIHFNDLYDLISRILIGCGGTLIVNGLPHPTVVTSNPANVEYILTTKFSSFQKGPVFRSAFRDIFGDGMFNADGELWFQQRKASVVVFNSLSNLNYVLNSVQRYLRQRLIPILDNTSSKLGSAIDLQDILFRFTFDDMWEMVFGVEMGCLTPSLPVIPFVKAFEDAIGASYSQFITPVFLTKIMSRLGFGIDAKLQSALKTINQFVMAIVSSRRKELSAEENGMPDSRPDLLSIFMQTPDKNGVLYSDTFLRDICLTFILAGGTSSVALSWFFWLLLQHPHVEGKILKEIQSILKDRSTDVKPADPVDFTKEELKEMRYLHACLSEAMRLYPPVPLGRKEAVEDDFFPDGTPIKKGTAVIYAAYAMGRMESIWGRDCMEFKPERWLNDEGAFVNQSVYKFPIFQGGPRMCLGRDFAYLRMKHIAASILYRYRVRLVNEGEQVKYKVGGLTLVMKNGLWVTLQPR